MRNSQLSLLISSMFCCTSFATHDLKSLLTLSLGVVWAVVHVIQCHHESETQVRSLHNREMDAR